MEEEQTNGHVQENSPLHMIGDVGIAFESLGKGVRHELHDQCGYWAFWCKVYAEELDYVGVPDLAVSEALLGKTSSDGSFLLACCG